MAVDDVVNRNTNVLEKDVPFDEEEAYYELCQIITMAQQTGNYTKFQSDLNQWKRHYPIESFSEKYKHKIKYMLSEEFLSSILKDYLAFEKHSKMDANKQLDKLRHIYEKAKVHKDEKKLDSDLQALYKEYPLSLLKEKFPHIVSKLISNSYREEILQKFNYKSAYEEFTNVIDNAKNFSSESEFEESIENLKRKYPLSDFSDEYKKKLEPLLKEDYLHKIMSDNIDVTLSAEELIDGTIISLQDKTNGGIFNQKTAYFELLEIMKNPNNVDGVFDWSYQYMRYIGRFDDYHKGLIISSLAPYYKYKKQANYRIPDMNSKTADYLSYDEYTSMNHTKKDTVLQFLALISTTGDISQDDINRMEVIHANVEKAHNIQSMSNELDLFVEKSDKNGIRLTPIDESYFNSEVKSELDISDSTVTKNNSTHIINKQEENIEINPQNQEENNNFNQVTDDIVIPDPNSDSYLITEYSDENPTISIDYSQTPGKNIEQNFNSLKTDNELDFTL